MSTSEKPFDTLAYAKKLENVGVPTEQAEVQSCALADVLGKSVAFPRDLAAYEHSFNCRFDAINAEMKVFRADVQLRLSAATIELATVRGEINLNRWMQATLIGLNLTILFKLFH